MSGCISVCVKRYCCNDDRLTSVRIDDLEEQIDNMELRNAQALSRMETNVRSAYIDVTPSAPDIELAQTINSEDLNSSISTVEAFPV